MELLIVMVISAGMAENSLNGVSRSFIYGLRSAVAGWLASRTLDHRVLNSNPGLT